jgi:hypothetical protein
MKDTATVVIGGKAVFPKNKTKPGSAKHVFKKRLATSRVPLGYSPLFSTMFHLKTTIELSKSLGYVFLSQAEL